MCRGNLKNLLLITAVALIFGCWVLHAAINALHALGL